MIDAVPIRLKFAPLNQYIDARIVGLSSRMIQEQVMGSWWTDKDLKFGFAEMPIDRYWDWEDVTIDYFGRPLGSEKIAVVAGSNRVEGAMLISTDPVPSILDPEASCLLLEWLFTAPRNRPELRRDGKAFVTGVGSELLIWAANFSRKKGCQGRLRLDASPNSVAWYSKRFLQQVGIEPIVYEGISYTPMELTAVQALKLVSL